MLKYVEMCSRELCYLNLFDAVYISFVFSCFFVSLCCFSSSQFVQSSAWTPFPLRGSQGTELPIGRHEDDSAMSGPRNTFSINIIQYHQEMDERRDGQIRFDQIRSDSIRLDQIRSD